MVTREMTDRDALVAGMLDISGLNTEYGRRLYEMQPRQVRDELNRDFGYICGIDPKTNTPIYRFGHDSIRYLMDNVQALAPKVFSVMSRDECASVLANNESPSGVVVYG